MLKPPERSDERGPLNSVIAEIIARGGAVEHPEYIVYKEGQSLPEYAIWYTHLPECRCTHCTSSIFIEIGFNGETVKLTVPSDIKLSSKVNDLIKKAHAKASNNLGIQLSMLHVEFQGLQLQGNQKLKQCGIKEGSTLQLGPTMQQIFVKLDDKTITVFVSLQGESVDCLKERIHTKANIPRERQMMLTFCGKMLKSRCTLSDYNIGREATVHMHLSHYGHCSVFAKSEWRIFVKTLTGKIIPLNVNSTDCFSSEGYDS